MDEEDKKDTEGVDEEDKKDTEGVDEEERRKTLKGCTRKREERH